VVLREYAEVKVIYIEAILAVYYRVYTNIFGKLGHKVDGRVRTTWNRLKKH